MVGLTRVPHRVILMWLSPSQAQELQNQKNKNDGDNYDDRGGGAADADDVH